MYQRLHHYLTQTMSRLTRRTNPSRNPPSRPMIPRPLCEGELLELRGYLYQVKRVQVNSVLLRPYTGEVTVSNVAEARTLLRQHGLL